MCGASVVVMEHVYHRVIRFDGRNATCGCDCRHLELLPHQGIKNMTEEQKEEVYRFMKVLPNLDVRIVDVGVVSRWRRGLLSLLCGCHMVRGVVV